MMASIYFLVTLYKANAVFFSVMEMREYETEAWSQVSQPDNDHVAYYLSVCLRMCDVQMFTYGVPSSECGTHR